ncbi:MAG: hypothetical protein WBD13_14745 [Burkholderiaceae bacterium]
MSLPLVACDQAPENDSYFPISKGRSWLYNVSTHFEGTTPDEVPMRIDALGSANLDGEIAWRRHTDTGMDYWVRADDTGIFRVSSKSALQRNRLEDVPHQYVLKQPYEVGNSWETITTSHVLRWRNQTPHRVSHRYPKIPMEHTIVQTGAAVSTLAGDFGDCIVVDGLSKVRLWVDAAFGWRDIPLNQKEWYCAGVGLVKMTREELSPSRFMVGGTMAFELIDWSE